MHRSTAVKIEQVKSILAKWYEAGRQDRNKGWVFRTHIAPVLGISRRTFSRWVNADETEVRRAMSGGRPVFEWPTIPGLA